MLIFQKHSLRRTQQRLVRLQNAPRNPKNIIVCFNSTRNQCNRTASVSQNMRMRRQEKSAYFDQTFERFTSFTSPTYISIHRKNHSESSQILRTNIIQIVKKLAINTRKDFGNRNSAVVHKTYKLPIEQLVQIRFFPNRIIFARCKRVRTAFFSHKFQFFHICFHFSAILNDIKKSSKPSTFYLELLPKLNEMLQFAGIDDQCHTVYVKTINNSHISQLIFLFTIAELSKMEYSQNTGKICISLNAHCSLQIC